MFPVALPEKCIKFSGVPKGSRVVDPFVGSGTTLVACENLGMEGLGFEIDESYVEDANRRLERLSMERPATVNEELDASLENQLPAVSAGFGADAQISAPSTLM